MTGSRTKRGVGRAAGIAVAVACVVALAAVWLAPDSDMQAALAVGGGAPPPSRVQRVALEHGRTVVRLTPAERAQIGVETALLQAGPHREELRAYGAVLEVARITDLTNSYANATAQLQTAQAKLEVSKSAFHRAKTLGQYVTAVQVESAEGAFRTDQAALAAAESQVKTLAATAHQEWGALLGRAIVERSPTITRLIEREEFLVQVTLPPGAALGKPPETGMAQVPAQDSRIELRFLSPATRTDQRIQGLSYFYVAPGDSGLLPGMSTAVFLPSDKIVEGVVVPEAAVVRWQGAAWVYLQVAPDTFARHQIVTDLAVSDGDYVVRSIPGQAEVVFRGAQALLSEETRALQGSGGADAD